MGFAIWCRKSPCRPLSLPREGCPKFGSRLLFPEAERKVTSVSETCDYSRMLEVQHLRRLPRRESCHHISPTSKEVSCSAPSRNHLDQKLPAPPKSMV